MTNMIECCSPVNADLINAVTLPVFDVTFLCQCCNTVTYMIECCFPANADLINAVTLAVFEVTFLCQCSNTMTNMIVMLPC